MILCLCRAVSDSRIRQEIADGAQTSEEVGRRCGAGTDCGSCLDDIEDMIDCQRECARQLAPVEAVYALRRAS